MQQILVAIDTGTYNVRKATCSYFCIWCDGYFTALLTGSPLGLGVSKQGSLTFSANWDGNTSYNVTNSATWNSSATSIATVATGTVTGVAVGSASISAYVELPYYYQYCAYDPTSCPSDYQSFTGSGSTTVATLSCSNSVIRGNTATCTVTPSGATVSGWKFVDSNGNIVTRTSNTSSLTWSGLMATTGVVSVTTGSSVLTAAIAVLPRPGFVFGAVSATSEPNGFSGDDCTLSVPSPPVSGQPTGFSCLTQTASWSTGWIGDGGINSGYSLVNSASMNNGGIATKYFYTISPDLQNTSSTFYLAQCGNYNAQSRPSGFISGANLLANTIRHESGSANSHYNNYVQSQNSAANNVGTIIEMQVYFGSNVTLANNIGPTVNQAISRINTAMEVEPCSPNYNASCNYQGAVNFSPYQSCN